MKLYNSLTNKIEEFNSIENKKINMYVCGPTVYGDIHIGNARPVVFFDIVRNYFEFIGYEVDYVSNITDIDDRIINKAIEIKTDEKSLAEKYTLEFLKVTEKLNSKLPSKMPKATEYIKEMIEYIENLLRQGYAYQTSNGVYFRVNKINDYGTLSNQTVENLNSGARIDIDQEKESAIDFALWKVTTVGINYKSPWGSGRPGWHTECAAINKVIFNKEIDIHGGGVDLKFPHHENEIAQTKALEHHHLAKYWMHVGRIDFENNKMSKSIGNTVLVKDLAKEYDLKAYRYLLLNHNYKHPINYTHALMKQFNDDYEKLISTIKKVYLKIVIKNIKTEETDKSYIEEFKFVMEDDFNLPNVVTLIQDLIKQINKTEDENKIKIVFNTLFEILKVLRIEPLLDLSEKDIDNYANWEKARNNKDYKLADELRLELTKRGWI